MEHDFTYLTVTSLHTQNYPYISVLKSNNKLSKHITAILMNTMYMLQVHS